MSEKIIITRIETFCGVNKRLEDWSFPSMGVALNWLQGRLPALSDADCEVIRAHTDTQIGPVHEPVSHPTTSYYAAITYDVRYAGAGEPWWNDD